MNTKQGKINLRINLTRNENTTEFYRGTLRKQRKKEEKEGRRKKKLKY